MPLIETIIDLLGNNLKVYHIGDVLDSDAKIKKKQTTLSKEMTAWLGAFKDIQLFFRKLTEGAVSESYMVRQQELHNSVSQNRTDCLSRLCA